jgi:hypothetical protein
MISEPLVHSTQTVHLSCVKISTIFKWTELSLEPRYLPLGASITISEPMVRWCKLCTYLAPTLTRSPNRKKQDSTWPMSPRSFVGWVQNDFWGYVTIDANRAPILCQD